jgi:hypothetical protein
MRAQRSVLIISAAAATLLAGCLLVIGVILPESAAPNDHVVRPGSAQTQQQDPATDLSHFVLRPATNQRQLGRRAAELTRHLRTSGVQHVLSTASRRASGRAGGPCNERSLPKSVTIKRSICFDPEDSGLGTHPQWTPQGVTTVADAQPSQRWRGGGPAQPIIVSWYNGLPNRRLDRRQGTRISVLNPATGAYEHVLLVYPTADGSYMSMRQRQLPSSGSLHAGGIVWYGNYLYVADVNRGFRIFDLRQILDLKASRNGNTTDTEKIGRIGKTYYGHGYRYVLPESAAYSNTSSSARACTTAATGPIFSYVGLDRTGADHLTSGEYCTARADPVSGRVATWPLDASTGKPKLTGRYWKGDSAYHLPQDKGSFQGALRWRGRWYLSRSSGGHRSGSFYTTDRIRSRTGTLSIDRARTRRLSIGPEDLSHWGGTSPFSGVWTVSEYRRKRMLYNIGEPDG